MTSWRASAALTPPRHQRRRQPFRPAISSRGALSFSPSPHRFPFDGALLLLRCPRRTLASLGAPDRGTGPNAFSSIDGPFNVPRAISRIALDAASPYLSSPPFPSLLLLYRIFYLTEGHPPFRHSTFASIRLDFLDLLDFPMSVLEKRASNEIVAASSSDIEERHAQALHHGPPPFRWASLWEPAQINPLNGKSYTLPILRLTDQYSINFHLAVR